jgi:ketosteroid isomerase-like protein
MGNADAVHRIYAAFGQGDMPGILAALAEDVEWEHDWGPEPLAIYAPRRGREAVLGFFAALAPYEFLRFEPAGFLEGPDMVAALIHVELRHRESGRTFRDLECHLWTFGPDGLVRRFRHFVDTRQFARMAGVDPG